MTTVAVGACFVCVAASGLLDEVIPLRLKLRGGDGRVEEEVGLFVTILVIVVVVLATM